MLVIAGGVLALILFVHLSLRAEAGDAVGLRFALTEAFILSLFAVFAGLAGLALFAIQCDESCDGGAREWWHTTGAWQWSAQLAVVVAGSIALAAAVVLTRRRRHREAIAAAVVAALFFGAWAAFLAPLGNAFGI